MSNDDYNNGDEDDIIAQAFHDAREARLKENPPQEYSLIDPQELADLRRFKRLATQVFEYPSAVDLIGFTPEEKRFLADAMEAENKRLLEEMRTKP